MKVQKDPYNQQMKDIGNTMVKTLSIECPHCNKTFDVFLSSNASMVILNCPLCVTPLIYYKTRCFVLSKHQIDRIRKSRQDTTVLKILHSIAREEPQSWHNDEDAVPVGKYMVPATSCRACGSDSITRDDVVNLRIDLETCVDSKDFIERI
jgi:hypothetical protein